jgi:hypothetical protein
MLLETLHPLLAAALGLTRGIGSATFPSMANWPEFIEQAERHRLIPLLHHYLLQTGLYASLPETAQGDLRDRIAGITARQLSFTHALRGRGHSLRAPPRAGLGDVARSPPGRQGHGRHRPARP